MNDLPHLWLYWDFDFQGSCTVVIGDKPDLREEKAGGFGENWNDETSSIVIGKGHWQFFEHINYEGMASPILGPGRYPTAGDFGLRNDELSSIRLISPD